MFRMFGMAAAFALVALPAAAQPAPQAVAHAERAPVDGPDARSLPPAPVVRGVDAPLSELLENPRTRVVVERELPELIAFLTSSSQRSLRYLASRAPDILPEERLQALGADVVDAPLSELRATPQSRAAVAREFPDWDDSPQFSISLRSLAVRMPDQLPPERLQALDAELSALRSDRVQTSGN